MAENNQPKDHYPPIEPFSTGMLKVSELHTVYYEVCGNPTGKPVVYLHGGPGAGCSADSRQFFDPAVYRIVLMDQRGAGRSTPHAELKDNNTWALVDDIESLRKHLDIDRWVVFGGSWGSTLALAYAITHPGKVKGLILRGIFTVRRSELEQFYQHGSSELFPDYWEDFLAPIPVVERADLMGAYHRRLTGTDEKAKLECAAAWARWECSTSRLIINEEHIKRADNAEFALAFARIENHYFVNGGFFPSEQYLLDNVDKIRHIPAVIVQGRYDVVCPMRTAWDLHKRWPEADLEIIPDAGHSAKEDGIRRRLVAAADKFREL